MLIISPVENFEPVIEIEYNSGWEEEEQSGGGGDECQKNQMEWKPEIILLFIYLFEKVFERIILLLLNERDVLKGEKMRCVWNGNIRWRQKGDVQGEGIKDKGCMKSRKSNFE